LSSDSPVMHSQLPIAIETEMKRSYLDYAMSVIVSRALPDCRDGLKPVHRRILYAMHAMNNYHDKPYKKAARVVGDVIGKYHPHGDSAIYMALVRMAQDFSLRVPLIDGQGNFGSVDGDSPAAMRYTEARLAKISSAMLKDIEQNTVEFQDNYDGAETEPKVLPARFPNLLVNGTNGIAVGMATNIPSHNLGEVIDACCAYIQNPEMTIEDVLEIVPAPDFPTGGMILGAQRAKIALATGRGSILVRGRVDIEEIGGKNAIIVKEIPYQVNKADLLQNIERLSRNKIIEGIGELRDESNKLGIRMVIELKKGFVPEVILNQIYKYTSLQTSFGVNMLALNKGRPQQMNVRDIIVAFIEFREEVVTKRTLYLLNKARDKAHSLIGLSLAVANIDEIIAIIRGSSDPAEARVRLMEKFWEAETVIPLLQLVDDYRNELEGSRCKFTHEQATAILEMKLQKLTGLEKGRIDGELKNLAVSIKDYLDILGSRPRLMSIITDELVEIKEKFATPRRTTIEMDDSGMDMEDLIQKEEMIVTTTMSGFIKRVPLVTYKSQRRGGKGRSAMSTHDDDATIDIISTNTHSQLLFFSDAGKVYRLKVYRLPLGSPQSKGRALVNLLPIAQDEKITNITKLPDNIDEWEKFSIMFATSKGNVRRNALTAFESINAGGKIAIRLDEDDKLVTVKICEHADHVMLSTSCGKALRFATEAIRVFKSRTSDGVRGIRLSRENDHLVSMTILQDSQITMEKREEYLKLPIALRTRFSEEEDSAELIKEIRAGAADLSLTDEEIETLALGEQFILTISDKGFGKRSSSYEYRTANRGGQGITNMNLSSKNGLVVTSMPVLATDQIILLTDSGKIIRTMVNSIRITGRSALGVKVFNIAAGEKVISVTKIANLEDEIDENESAGEESSGENSETLVTSNDNPTVESD